MRNRRQGIITALLALSVLCVPSSLWAAQPSVYQGTDVAKLAWQAPVHWVSVAQIKQSLAGKPPMAVGFDIDDTVLFSSPGFWRGQQLFSPGKNDYLTNPAFYDKMNNGWDVFSLPKKVGEALIAMHVQRGDEIYFITGRMKTATETVSATLQTLFHIPPANMHPVIFADSSPTENTKVPWIKREHIKIYYGDSDSDITAARAAGARGIRVLRAANSTYQPLPQAGDFGEEVIVNSQY